MTKRRDREDRRNLNTEEMESMGFADLAYNANEDGWAYPDDDDEETTENYRTRCPLILNLHGHWLLQ